ncbi:MAG: AI-2E family transporter [Polyangiaceae bacterium]
MERIRSRALLVLAVVASLAFAKWAAAIVVPVLLAILVAVGFWPLTKRIAGPRWVVGPAVVVLVLGTMVLFGWLVALAATGIPDTLPTYAKLLVEARADLATWLVRHGLAALAVTVAQQNASDVAEVIVTPWVGELADLMGLLALVGGLSLLLIFELTTLERKLMRQGPVWAARMAELGRRTQAVQRYLVIKAAVSLVTGLLAGLLTAALDVPHAILWGLLAFVFNFIPVVGSYIAAFPPILVAGLVHGPRLALVLAVGYAVINTLVGFVIEPRLAGRAAGLSPFVVVLSIMFWGWMFGPIGALASVPLTMVVRLVLESGEETRWLAVLLDARRASEVAPPSWRPPRNSRPSTAEVGTSGNAA